MSNEVDTQPNGPCRARRRCPGTRSSCSWRSMARPSSCGASRTTPPGCRTVSADAIANVFTQHLGSSSGLLPEETLWWNQGETGQVVGPLAAAAGLARGPATGGVQASRPAPAPHAGAGLRLLAGPRALGLRRAEPAHRPRAAPLPGPGLQRLRRREGLSRKPPVPRGGRADTGVLLPVLLLAYRRFTGPLEEARRQPASAMGGDRWNNCIPDGGPGSPVHGGPGDGGLRRETGLPLAPAPGPVGYLVNHPGGLAGVQGIGYDYVLGSGGVYVQSQSAHLTARVLVAPGAVRGLAPVAEKVELTHGPIPAQPLRAGAALVPGRPGHRAVLRRAVGRGRLPAGRPPAGGHRHETRVSAPGRGGRRVPLPRRRPRLLLGHRRPGRAGLPHLRRRRTPRRPGYRSCVSGSASTATSPRRTGRRCSTARTRESASWANTTHQTNDKEVN